MVNYPFKNCFMETSLHHFIIAAICETVFIHWTTAGVIVEPDVLWKSSHFPLFASLHACFCNAGETITLKYLFSCRFPHCRWFWSLTIHLCSYAYLIQAWRGWARSQSLFQLAGQVTNLSEAENHPCSRTEIHQSPCLCWSTQREPMGENVQTKPNKPGFKPSTFLSEATVLTTSPPATHVDVYFYT